MTQPTSGGTVTAVTNGYANCVEPSCTQQWGPDSPFFGQAGHADRWMAGAASHKSGVMSRLNQVRQHHTNESGFAISAINKYILGSRYPLGATGLNTGCASDAQVSAKHNTQIPGPAIYTDNPDSHLHTRHNTTPPDPGPNPLSTPHLHHPHHRNTDTHPNTPPRFHRIGKVQTQSSLPLTPLSTHAAPRQTHTHLTYSTNSHPMHHTHL